ncbi:sulfatase-like hydrolase/transferase [Luteolibacter sp. GHJ8]|uniref:Sulfatase-like hydrolase/transferase n=1 Tax=Luteolibacter rhizosphaerae TaxID=2989719 RepID=A0ABT3GA88_9BACT|nr:sulfatase-like hydrolase/transferase [Luteolibacter rhizosphaerae]MCW1916130.1 sulfatase-like hydrolase/transferase [Luteolibacter rhizosphaerae]
MIRRSIALILLALTARLLAAPPNVIVIFTDDQGYADAGCYGSPDFKTPSIDRLAREGVRFTRFYAGSAVCSPSRACLMTGRYPWKAGLEGNAAATVSESINDLSQAPPSSPGLPSSELTLAELFRMSGYATAHIGKWHLGPGPGMKPLDQGFSYSFGHMNGCIDNYSHFVYWGGPNRHDLWENNLRVHHPGRFFPDLMVEKASSFLEENRAKPFFMYFAVNLPHYPYQSDPEIAAQYAHLLYPRNLYAAALASMDARIGRLLDKLDQLDLRRNTIVVFQADQGASTEERAHGGGGDNGPFRGSKFSLFEGGIRVPAIISWPSTLPHGETRSATAHGADWFPTLAALCKLPLPSNLSLDGHDLGTVIASPETPSPHQFLQWRLQEQWAVIKGPWKLIHRPNDVAKDGPPLDEAAKQWFLVNLDNDPAETRSVAADHPGIVEELKALRP